MLLGVICEKVRKTIYIKRYIECYNEHCPPPPPRWGTVEKGGGGGGCQSDDSKGPGSNPGRIRVRVRAGPDPEIFLVGGVPLRNGVTDW